MDTPTGIFHLIILVHFQQVRAVCLTPVSNTENLQLLSSHFNPTRPSKFNEQLINECMLVFPNFLLISSEYLIPNVSAVIICIQVLVFLVVTLVWKFAKGLSVERQKALWVGRRENFERKKNRVAEIETATVASSINKSHR